MRSLLARVTCRPLLLAVTLLTSLSPIGSATRGAAAKPTQEPLVVAWPASAPAPSGR